MKKQLVFIHGGSAFSQHDAFLEHLRTIPIQRVISPRSKKWSETLQELGSEWETFTPTMPNAQNAKYAEWKIWFERHFEILHGEVVLVGWSLGGLFLAKYLAENPLPFSVKALHLVAAPFPAVLAEGEDGGDFTFEVALLQNLQEMAKNMVIYHSKDDLVVPYSDALAYKEAIPSVSLVTFDDRGHFLRETFPELIAKIQTENS